MKKIFNICIVLCIIEFIAAWLVLPYLPEQIPTHWGINGQVDQYGPAYMVFLAPSIALFITILMGLIPKIDPKGENIIRSGKAFPVLVLILNILFLVIGVITTLSALGYNIPVGTLIPVMIGILFIIIGNYLPKVKSNYTFGIRLPWTLANETVWKKTHRLGGWCFTILGVLFIIGTTLPTPYNFVVPIVGLFLLLIVITLYSYAQYKKIGK